MPVVLSTGEGAALSGYQYDDRTGISYEYPEGKYEKYVVEGERFLYHQPGGVYTGSGVIGLITPSDVPGRLVCEILDYDAFPAPVSIKDDGGSYYEADPDYWKTGKIYWSQGVRPLSALRYEAVLGSVVSSDDGTVHPPSSGAGYGGPDSPEVDAYAVREALKEVRRMFPDERVEEMPHNNPGFDIRVGPADGPVHYVEVKGTSTAKAVFLMSEGQRAFSIAHASNYSLLVVVGIHLHGPSHSEIRKHSGAVAAPGVELTADHWRGRLC